MNPRIAYTTTFNAEDVHNWSGTPYHMSKAFLEAGIGVDYIGSLKRKLPRFFKVKQGFRKYVSNQRESPRFNITAAKHYSHQVAKILKASHVNAIVSPLINPIAYLDTDLPIVLWTDALYGSLVGFYPPFNYHSADTINQGNTLVEECLSRAKLALFSSDWAAESALTLYGASKEKVHVVPFGANLQNEPDYQTVVSQIKKRSTNKIKLLFLAKSWERKGGNTVLAVTERLHQAGVNVELLIVGYNPPNLPKVPYIKCLGFISKHTEEGRTQLNELLLSSHFLFVPSRAEAYGIVFCEANAFGLPCLTTYVGGIGTIVKDNVNGMTFALDAPVDTYCHYITNLMADPKRYEELALSSYQEYKARLNWHVATQRVKKLLENVL